jgi:hypothetical protein
MPSDTEAEKRLKDLRVAHFELTNGDTTGKVYVRPSRGAAFFLAEDRSKATRTVEKEIQRIVARLPSDAVASR